ncbi:MAG: hypothetical protein J5582_09205 [Ruminococcus sp.]|uniref:hypothetical protein n=1 Tax=Ruminococcus sp. TaxID=41978 RepID=UPI0025E47785|nr:hypothetical protein [Ruminococcus sp.]MBO4866725.1 hypothetical protein [Ruminococcus sp.]
MTPIFAVILAAPIVLGITVLIYMFYYRRKINKRLAEGSIAEKRKGKPMMPPIVFVLITIICVSAVTALLVIALSIFSFKNFTSSGNSNGGFDGDPIVDVCMVYKEDLENSPFEGYKTGDEIKGYKMSAEKNGDFTFYCYYVNDNMQGVLPRLIVVPDTKADTSRLSLGFIIKAEEGKKELTFNGSGEPYMFTFDRDSFEGTIRFEEFYFDEALNGTLRSWEEKSEESKVKGVLELDMSYPEPEE